MEEKEFSEIIPDEKIYEKEYSYVVKKAKSLAATLRGIKFDVLKYKNIYFNFLEECKKDFKFSINGVHEPDDYDEKIDGVFSYEFASERSFTINPDVDYEEIFIRKHRSSFYCATNERIRITIKYNYFTLILDTINGYFSSIKDKNLHITIYDNFYKEIREAVSMYDFDFWIDKDFTLFSRFVKPISTKIINKSDYSDLLEESKRYFSDSRTTSLVERFVDFLKNKKN